MWLAWSLTLYINKGRHIHYCNAIHNWCESALSKRKEELSTFCFSLLVIVKVPEVKVARSRRPGLLRPDYSEKSQSRWTSTSSAGVKVDVTLAPGLQVKDLSKKPKSATSLDVFRDSTAGALPAIWARLP